MEATDPGQGTVRIRLSAWSAAMVMGACTLWLGYGVEQNAFGRMVIGFVPFFLAYGWLIRAFWTGKVLSFWIALGIALRVALLFSFPALSDDVYRFLWDGRLIVQGLNPFDHLPGWYLQEGHRVPGLEEGLFQKLNSPGYFTVYPPLAQGTFALGAWLFPNSLSGSVLVMKAFLLACELGSLLLLRRLLAGWGLAPDRLLIYWLNPLVIVELVGNLHYEAAMLFFVLLALWLLVKRQHALAGLAFAFGVGAKLVPLIFLPMLLRRLAWREWLVLFLCCGLGLVALFYPLGNSLLLSHFGESLDLYFRKFEFNASVYYLARWVGFQRVGYNMIARVGPVLAGLTGILIFSWILWERRPSRRDLPRAMLVAITLFLALATTVHPWYVATPLLLCVFTDFRFPVLWTALIWLTYVNYSYVPYRENLWVVGLEYGLVAAFALAEVYRRIPERGRRGQT